MLSACTPVSWQASGRFAAKNENKGWSGSFEWTQITQQNYRIHFYGPFGVGNTYLIGDNDHVIWRDNSGITNASSPEALVYEKTGFLFPVSYLYDWLRGRPTDAEPVDNKVYDAQGHLMAFSQAGWHIQYLAYASVKQGELPVSMVLKHDTLHIKLLISHWDML